MSLNVMAAIPTHSGSMVIEGVETLLGLQQMVLARGGNFQLRYQTGATISQVRNVIAAAFLASGADILFMLDADQAIAPADVMRMIDFDRPFVGSILPRRRYDWSKVSVREGESAAGLVQQAMGFVGWLKTASSGQVDLVDGFSLATHVGAGILVLRRQVFDHLMQAYPELEGRGFGSDTNLTHDPCGRWGFFNPLENQEGVPLSEDLSFCRRWQAAGGEIWADIIAPVAHIGSHRFFGSYFDHLRAREP